MNRLMLAIPILAALTLAGCTAATPAATVSENCRTAMTALGADDGIDFDKEDALITDTTNACTTSAEYIAAVKENPGAWLYDSADEVKPDLVIISVCLQNKNTPLCLDAAEQGQLD